MELEEEGRPGWSLSLAGCARSESAPSMRAVKASLATPSGDKRLEEIYGRLIAE